MPEHKSLLLVHGAWAANWVWDPVVPVLQQAGLKIAAPTLPGQIDGLPASEINLPCYVDFVIEQIVALADGEPVCLVGHSGSGMVISQVAEARPDLIDSLVYVAGFMLPTGKTFPELCHEVYGDGVEVGASLEVQFDASGDYVSLKKDNLHPIFFNCCDPEVSAPLIEKFLPHPIPGWNLVNQLSEQNFGSVSRHYIYLSLDNSVPPALQDRMLEMTPGATVHKLDTDHVPQVSATDELANILLGIAR